MLENLVTVAGQVSVLFLLIAAGFFCGKSGLIQQSALTGINNLVLYVAIPCTLIKAFQLDLTPQTLRDFLTALACAAGAYALFFPVSVFLIRDRDDHRKRLMTLASTVSNCNFMGFPLQTAVLGSLGIFYGSAYAAMTPLFIWTIGILYLEGGRKSFRIRKVLLNPGVFGIAAGLVIFLGRITLPDLLGQAVNHLANLAVPLPMVVIGVQLAFTDLRRAVRDGKIWLTALLRLVLLPLLALFLMLLCGVRGSVLVATVIAAAAPPAVIVVMLDRPDSTLGAELVSLLTLLSIATMPLVVSLAQTLA